MSARESGTQHRKKFLLWQQRVGQKTRQMSQLVEAHILPPLLGAGFERVHIALHQAQWTVNANEIRLERGRSSEIDSVDIIFGKYGDPKFQIAFSRRELSPPHRFIRSGVLVKRSDQRYCFWGKPQWLPSSLWSHERSRQTVVAVASHLAQVIEFLDSGEQGPNISAE